MTKNLMAAVAVSLGLALAASAHAETDPNADTSGLPITGGFEGYGPSAAALGQPRAVRPSVTRRLEEPRPVRRDAQPVQSHATLNRRPPPPAPAPQPVVVTRPAVTQQAPVAAARAPQPQPVMTPAPRNLSASVRATMPQAPNALEDASEGGRRVAGPGPRPQQVAVRAPEAPEEPQIHLGVPPDDFPNGILIDVSDRTLYYIENGAIIRNLRVAVPRRNATRIFGDTEITRKRPNPTWRPTPRMIREDPSLPEVVGPGPNNPLGSRALNTGWQYIAIHGTSNPGSIGRMASSGCYRLLNEDVEWLYRRVAVGTPVRVRR